MSNAKPFFKFVKGAIARKVVAESPASSGGKMKGECFLGAYSYIGSRSEITAANIGRYCSIAPDVTIGPTNHPTNWFSSHLFVFGSPGPFKASEEFKRILKRTVHEENHAFTLIGNDVWIGRAAIIKRGVKIGDGAIIGAGAVVVKDVAPYEIVGGVPAKHIRFRFSQEIIDRFIKIQWWNYNLDHIALRELDFSNVEESLSLIEKLIESGELEELSPVVRTLIPGDELQVVS